MPAVSPSKLDALSGGKTAQRPLVYAQLRPNCLTRNASLLAYQEADAFKHAVKRDGFDADRINLSILLTAARWTEPGIFTEDSTGMGSGGEIGGGGGADDDDEGDVTEPEILEHVGFELLSAQKVVYGRQGRGERAGGGMRPKEWHDVLGESVAERVKRRKRRPRRSSSDSNYS
ncbi:hypothetical protein MPH_05910 [Macrophomina phaseolina MS6]|uniref:Uncharacterized protein n=1 Tax=Macrophomina phaseolina (strain MS6) TaxID=1126212 RepID=K2S332_MACPH|nr:hypothetical protein MPH_05910 [Macrophomina phaseolina MS6]